MLTPEEYADLSDDADEALLEFLEIAIPRAVQAQSEAESSQEGDSFEPWCTLAATLGGILDALGRENDFPVYLPVDYNERHAWRSTLKADVERLRGRLAFQIRRGPKRQTASEIIPVHLEQNHREEIRNHTRKIRAILNNINVTPNLRQLLFDRLNKFEFDLDRTRTRYDALFAFLLDATHAVGEGAENLKPAIDQAERIAGIMRGAEKTKNIGSCETKGLPAPQGEESDAKF